MIKDFCLFKGDLFLQHWLSQFFIGFVYPCLLTGEITGLCVVWSSMSMAVYILWFDKTCFFAEQTNDGFWTGVYHLVRGLPGLPARTERKRPAAVWGHRQWGRAIHEEEDFQMGLMMHTLQNCVCLLTKQDISECFSSPVGGSTGSSNLWNTDWCHCD